MSDKSSLVTEAEIEMVRVAEADLKEKVRQATTPAVIDPDICSDSELRQLVKQQSALIAQLLAAQSPVVEPLGEDQYSGLPVFFEKPECPRCKPFSEMWQDPETGLSYPVCHDCNQPVPRYDNQFGGHGLESVSVDHLHTHQVQVARGSIPVRTLARRELCLPCFRIDWAKVHPDKACDL